MAGMFSNTFTPDDNQADPQQPSDPLVPDPVVYDNPDSPDDRGPGDPTDGENGGTDGGLGEPTGEAPADDFGGF